MKIFVCKNKFIIKRFLTSNHCFKLKYECSIYNIAFPSKKKSQNIHRSSTIYKWKQSKTNMSVDFDVRRQYGLTFSQEELLLWIMGWNFGQKRQFKLETASIMYFFLTNTQLLTLEDFNWWVGVIWITVMFYQLSGWHPFIAGDPLVNKWCKATFRVSTVSANFLFLGGDLFL